MLKRENVYVTMNSFKNQFSLINFDIKLLENILFSIDIPFIIFNKDCKILFANERFYYLVQMKPEELLAKKIEINTDRLKDQHFFMTLNAKITNSHNETFIDTPLNIVPFEYNNEILYLGTIHDGYYDNVTGFPNLSIFELNFDKAITSAKRRNKILALLFIDIDKFKFINDTYGHLIGDQIIKNVANIFESCLRIDDFITRKGGDEFLILLNDLAKKEDINIVLEKIFSHFEKPFKIENQSILITLSIGISIFPDDGDNVKELIKKADYVMYKAKKIDKNSYAFYSSDLENDLKLKYEIEKQLLDNYKNNFKNFEIVFQPIYTSLEDKQFSIDALEVFLRWKMENYGLVNTNSILEIAKQKGFIFEIDKFVIIKVIEFLNKNPHFRVPIHLNISSRMFYDLNFINYLTNTVYEYNLPPELFILEITESTLNQNTKHSIEILSTLKEKKFLICIDDFTSQNTNLPLLFKIKPDYLKINFNVKDKKELNVLLQIIDSIYFIFKTKIIANKVENPEIFKALVNSKRISYYQGYHFTKTFKVQEILNYLEKGLLYEF